LSFQAGRAWGNFKADLTELGWVTLPQLTGEFRHLGDTLHGVQAYLHQHRTAENWIAGGVAGVTGLSAAALAIAAFGKAIAFVNSGFRALGGAKVLQFGGDVAGLNGPLSSASGGLRGLAGVLRGISGQLGVLGAGFAISGAQQGSAATAYQSIARKYGSRYANYLLHGGARDLIPGRPRAGIDDWPWNYNPGQIPKGALNPHDWNLLNPGQSLHASAPVHLEQHFNVSLAPGTTAQQAKAIVALAMRQMESGMRSRLRSRGEITTVPHEPGVHHLIPRGRVLGVMS
jgi:hypothetical protein